MFVNSFYSIQLV